MKTLKRFLLNKWTIIIVIILIIVGYFVFRGKSNSSNIEFATASVGNIIEQVSVTGKVVPINQADLAFEKSGVLTSVDVAVGDHVSRGQTLATLDSATDQAAVSSAQATLSDMSRSLTPQELAVAKTAVETAEKGAVDAAADAYNKTQSAIVNYSSTLFSGPQSANPKLLFSTQTADQERRIELEQVNTQILLQKWNTEVAIASSSSADMLIADTEGFLTTVTTFANDLATAANALAQTSAPSQTNVVSYIATVNSLNAAIVAATSEVTTAGTSLATAESNYNLKLAGNSVQSIAAQAAKVAQAQALLAQDILTSPIDGVVTQADPTVGEFVGAGTTGFAVQSSGQFKIEAYVAEADIAKVAVGNLASTTLDAYGSNTDFPSSVTAIDPAETILQGVPTYKVTLYFVTPDSRIRSGMTANLEILTHEHDNVLEVPARAILSGNASTTARILNPDGTTYATVPVTAGLKGSDGMIEILSGLTAGDKVVTYIK